MRSAALAMAWEIGRRHRLGLLVLWGYVAVVALVVAMLPADDRGPRLEIFLGFFLGNLEDHFFFEGDDADNAVEGLRQIGCRLYVQSLVDAGEDAPIQERFQKILGANVELFREFADGDAFGQLNVARGARFGRRNRCRSHAAAACSGALTSRMEFALSFHFALVGHRALPLLRLARVKGLSWLRLRRLFGKR